jgi:EAL domain-containing protein (putative c-di-GMP-specific phosphodiesterase class I)
MCAPVGVGGRDLHSSVSIGIADVVADTEPEVLVSRAVAAMERARHSGPARFAVFDGSPGTGRRRDGALADDLRVAHSRGELSLDYQPVFHLDRSTPDRLSGMEALLRWNHPELGAVDPDVFVPLLEQSRQIVAVGRWLLEEAAAQCLEWQGRYPDLTMSVNVSARQLGDPGFLEDVGDALRRSGLDPAHLVLEVAESVLVVDVVRIGAAMQAVHDLGVRIAIDDFGTGHSSLLYLQGLPIDRLKIDRTFVEALGVDDHDATVVRTVVELAHRLGIAVVAEGVETTGELRGVVAIGCDEAQGYLLGPPLPSHRQTFDFDHLVTATTT